MIERCIYICEALRSNDYANANTLVGAKDESLVSGFSLMFLRKSDGFLYRHLTPI